MFEAKQLTEHGKIYLEAANLLEKKGWCQNRSMLDGKVCMGEALYRATFGSYELSSSEHYFVAGTPEREKWESVNLALTKFIGRDVVGWNDTPGRTKAEVIEKLREAAYNP